MKIVFIRHAEPDYENNTLTEKGFREAKCLSKHYSINDFDEIYSSPLPRAYLTAKEVIKDESKIIEAPWLVEFLHFIEMDNNSHLVWDFKPSELINHSEIIKESYLDDPKMVSGNENINELYKEVTNSFDNVLRKHGYIREGDFYRVVNESKETIVFFCHFGVMSVLCSHLLHVPFTSLANFTVCLPTGVTTFVTEEREKGLAQFRMLSFGDISHLKMENEEPSFMARFCETFSDDTRH